MAKSAEIYVIGSLTHLPQYGLTIPAEIKIFDRPTYGQVRIYLESTSNMNGYCTNYPVHSSDTYDDLKLFSHQNSGDEWGVYAGTMLTYTLPADYSTSPEPVTIPVTIQLFRFWCLWCP